MVAATPDRVDAALPLDDEGAVAYCRLWQRGLRVVPRPDGMLDVGPREQVTDEVRAIVAAHKPAVLAAARHRAAWAREPWSEDRCNDLVQSVIRGIGADPAVELTRKVAPDEIRAGAAGLAPRERKIALAVAAYDEAWERVEILRMAGEEAKAKAAFHSDYWAAGEALRALMEESNWRMPRAVAVLCGDHPAWAACEGMLDDAIKARSMDAVWLACLSMRYAAAVAKQKRIAKEAQEEVW